MRSRLIFCAYHPNHRAMVRCSACHRPLCPACDHRIKGFPYCQDCIVRGVEMLRRSASWATSGASGRLPSPPRAAACALIPGLGAVYNRQNTKALVHFLLIVGLWELADLTDLALFGLGGVVFYLFSIFDAYRTAQAIARGADPAEEEERLRRALRERMGWLALGLILLGGTVLLADVARALGLPFALRHLWPVFVIVLGVYLVRQWYRRRLSPPGEISFEFGHAPPPLFWKTGPLTGPLVEAKSGREPKPPARGPGG